MLKKFKKWREDLTWKQVKIIYKTGVLLIILCVMPLILKLNYFLYEKVGAGKIPAWVLMIIIAFIWICMMEFVVCFVFDGMYEKSDFKKNKIKATICSKLKEDEFTQVYLRRSRRIDVSVIILDVYDMYDIEYFAKKQGDDIYVVSKENGEILNDYTIKNVRFFDRNFQFEKEK